ncbi:MAG: hypothetical protein JNN15_02225 [Blastocatellia bacterium]|nr:hypothetical protein [Blastocatellia bacterium]
MKRLLLLLFILLISVEVSFAGSADKVLEKYKKATGGDVVKKLKTTLITGTAQKVGAVEQEAGSFSYTFSEPDKLLFELTTQQEKYRICFNGKSVWKEDSKGAKTVLGDEKKNFRLYSILLNSRLRDLSKYKISNKLAEKTTIENKDAVAVDFSLLDASTRIFFDVSSNLPINLQYQISDSTEEIVFSDYRKVEKTVEPFQIRIKSSVGEYLLNVSEVNYNRSVDQKTFLFPQPEGQTLPDVEQLLTAVMANQKQVQERREFYTFRKTETTNQRDGKGEIKETETNVYDVIPVSREFVEKLVIKNGKELSESERKKEDKRVEKEIAEIRKEQQKRENNQKKKKKDDDDDERVNILAILQTSEVTSVRRENFRDHEVIAFDFEPRKSFKPKNRAENIINKLAGTFFVDEQAKQIVRLEAKFLDSFKIGGGLLASISPNTAFVFEQEKIRDEIWLPSYAEINISAKALLFVKFNQDTIFKYSDYKKYQTDVETKFDED